MPSSNITLTAPNKINATKQIKLAAQKTGVDFEYLLQTAKRESALNPNAKAKSSSATGLFQFVKQTWYETLDTFGAKHGYGEFAAQIKRGTNGRYYVPNKQAESAILELRKDPKVASLMAAEFSKQNTQYLQKKIGHQPKASELYMAHFMGRGAAARLISLNERAPNIKADEVFPKHAASNKPIFYDKKGRARSIGQVYDNLSKHHKNVAKEKGLDPQKIADVYKLVPFLPKNDGFFGSLFGQQNNAANMHDKTLAYTGIGSNNDKPNAMNSLLFTQIEGQKLPNYKNQGAIPLPEYDSQIGNSGSIAKGQNFFSLTSRK